MTAPATNAPVLLEVRGLRKHFPVIEGILGRRAVAEVRAVDGVDFALRRGETLGLVGESGCGKTTIGRCILLLERPTAGEILYDGVDLTKLKHRQLRALRRRIQVIFQDPYSSLNPRMRVGDIIAEPLVVNEALPKAKVRERVQELLNLVGLRPGSIDLFPHEFSGGQRQRIAIARAVLADPRILILDEATSNLDTESEQAIQSSLATLMENRTCFVIAHRLSTIRNATKILVFDSGRVIESGTFDELIAKGGRFAELARAQFMVQEQARAAVGTSKPGSAKISG